MHPHPRQNNTFTGLSGGYEALFAAPHRFSFNGKESDSEVKGEGNQQDYGMRVYDNRLGRFFSVDPLVAKFAYYSSYQFSGNRPIWAIDLDGKEDEWYKISMMDYIQGQAQLATKAGEVSSDIVSPFILTATGVIMPIINQGYIIVNEGAHEGPQYNPENKLEWAVPYSLQNWVLIPERAMMSEYLDYNDGKRVMGSTASVILTFTPISSPIKSNDGATQKVYDMIFSSIIKTPIKKGVENITDVNVNETTAGENNGTITPFSFNYQSNQFASSNFSYTIKKGDTLSGIARQFNTSVKSIAEKNDIENLDLIIEGNTITIN